MKGLTTYPKNPEKPTNINTYYKEKDSQKKEKEKINYLEHTVTTDFSIAETNPEIKTDKIVKGFEKLNDTFLKAMIFYKILGIKSGETNISINKAINDDTIIIIFFCFEKQLSFDIRLELSSFIPTNEPFSSSILTYIFIYFIKKSFLKNYNYFYL